MYSLELSDLSKCYRIVESGAGLRMPWAKGKEHWALQQINMKVEPGEVIALLGANGSGKSTLLKVISQITSPTQGKLQIKGSIGAILEVSCGFHPELTGKENIFLNGAILGMHYHEIKAKYESILDFADIKEAINWEVKKYSSGMKVRLGFSIAAHLQTEILLIDEALAVGDQEFQQKCINKLRTLAQSGKTVIFVSHDAAAVKSLCTRGIVLKKGNLIFDGNLTEAYAHYSE